MPTECISDLFGFARVESRRVEAAFDGGAVTSNGGALLLGATERAIGLVAGVCAMFPGRPRSGVDGAQRRGRWSANVCSPWRWGYEDLIDHDELRHDPVMAVLAGKLEARRADCAPLAGKSTLNRLEHRAVGGAVALSQDRPRRGGDRAPVRRAVLGRAPAAGEADHHRPRRDPTIRCTASRRIGSSTVTTIVTAICRCTFFCGRHLLAAKLRPANIDGAAGAIEELARIVEQIRDDWPDVRILVRADSGFAREALMAWCEANRVDYVFGLARNKRLSGAIEDALAAAAADSRRTGKPARRYQELVWTTRKSWSRERRVVAKAEWTHGKANPRFVVTSLGTGEVKARRLYEKVYCARGDMENRIKECQADLFADRTSAATMRANQLRLWFAAMAYALLCALRRIALKHTRFARATCGTIRLKLLKIGAQVRRSVRRVKFAMASSFPYQQEYRLAHHRLCNATG